MQRCHRASGKCSAALSIRPRQASEMTSCTPLRPRSTRWRRNADHGFVLLGALADPQDLAKPFRIDGRGHQQRNVADLAGPAALHDNAVEVEIRMLALDPPVPPGLDLGVDLLVRFDTVLGLTRVPHSASVMSSTRRTEIPARYISISASSTELSRRR